MAVASLFSHARMAPFAEILKDSPTAVRLMADLEQVATKVQVMEVPDTVAGVMKASRRRWGGRYVVPLNVVQIPEASLSAEGIVRAGEHIPGQDMRQTAAILAHEGVHRLQRPRMSRMVVTGMVTDSVARVRRMVDTSLPQGPMRRFVDGAERHALQFETEAHTTQALIESELGLTTSRTQFVHDGVVDVDGLYESYKGKYAGLRRSALIAPVILGASAVAAAVHFNSKRG